MDTENHQATPEATAQAAAPRQANWGKRIAIGGLALVAVSGVGIAGALSDNFGGGRYGDDNWGPRHQQMDMRGEHGPRGPMGGMMGGPMGGMGERGLERMLDAVGATPEQAEKLRTIFGTLRDEVRPMAADFRGSREEVAKLLGAPTIDRAAAEKLRSERVAELDQASQKVTAALLDAAEVLTPEQRAKLLEHFQDRGGRGRW